MLGQRLCGELQNGRARNGKFERTRPKIPRSIRRQLRSHARLPTRHARRRLAVPSCFHEGVGETHKIQPTRRDLFPGPPPCVRIFGCKKKARQVYDSIYYVITFVLSRLVSHFGFKPSGLVASGTTGRDGSGSSFDVLVAAGAYRRRRDALEHTNTQLQF